MYKGPGKDHGIIIKFYFRISWGPNNQKLFNVLGSSNTIERFEWYVVLVYHFSAEPGTRMSSI